MNKGSSGPRYAILAALLFGASTPAAKALLTGSAALSPWLMAGILYLGSGVGLALCMAGRAGLGLGSEASLGRREFPWLFGAILFGGALAPVLLLYGLAHLAPGSASLLLNLEGVFTTGLAWFAFREAYDRRIFWGMALILAGGVALSFKGTLGGSLPGVALVAGAGFCWALDNNLTRRISGSDPIQIAMLKGLMAGTTNILLASFLHHDRALLWQWAVGGALGFLGYGLSLVCFVLALRQLGTARTGAYFSLAPFVGVLMALAAGSEAPSLRLAAAGILMGAGVWLHLTERHVHEHGHEGTEHTEQHRHDDHHQHGHPTGVPEYGPHTHPHDHQQLVHIQAHYPDLHHPHQH